MVVSPATNRQRISARRPISLPSHSATSMQDRPKGLSRCFQRNISGGRRPAGPPPSDASSNSRTRGRSSSTKARSETPDLTPCTRPPALPLPQRSQCQVPERERPRADAGSPLRHDHYVDSRQLIGAHCGYSAYGPAGSWGRRRPEELPARYPPRYVDRILWPLCNRIVSLGSPGGVLPLGSPLTSGSP